jgi:hypothetical protein
MLRISYTNSDLTKLVEYAPAESTMLLLLMVMSEYADTKTLADDLTKEGVCLDIRKRTCP